MEKTDEINLAVTYLVDTWRKLTECITQEPDKLLKSQLGYWQDYQQMYQELLDHLSENKDKRFKHEEWKNNLALNFIKQSYVTLSTHVNHLIDEMENDKNKDVIKRLRFSTKQVLDALAPTNFAMMNPEVMAEMADTHGENFVAGFQQFLQDIEAGEGQLKIKMTDMSTFKIGENIACTPGEIIYQNDLMQLIYYTPSTSKVYQCPLLIIPPWINKYYILDLQQENSWVKWLVDQGFSVFLISWVNPTEKQKDKQFSDYMYEGPIAAMKVINKMTQNNPVNIVGYCVGGTLLGCMLAYLAKKKDSRIASATFLTTLLDFSEPGELGSFIDEEQLNFLDDYMQAKGYLDGRVMAGVFNALRANDLIWSSFVNNYLKGQKPKAFDLLYWNADSTNIAAKVHSFYLRNMYLNNLLIQKNKLELSDTLLDLSRIDLPCYFLAAQDDHIVPWTTSYRGSCYVGGDKQFVLTSSGHVAGVVNPPQKKKYGYWTNQENSETPEQFFAGAKFTGGSWWDNWALWQKQYSGELVSIKKSSMKKPKKIEDAPGSYVKKQIELE